MIPWREIVVLINLVDGNYRVNALAIIGFKSCWALIQNEHLRTPEEIALRQPVSENLELASRTTRNRENSSNQHVKHPDSRPITVSNPEPSANRFSVIYESHHQLPAWSTELVALARKSFTFMFAFAVDLAR